MARRSSTAPPEDFEEHIVDVDVRDEMRSSYLEYAYSVIYSRALPDARDGLKPVQRRILYTMHDMGVRPDRGHVKSARVVGEVMGRLHPHGDGAIYDALVRMVQPWALRLPLIDGHGNFGSPDDPPAAMRYSECRMAPAATAMTQGIDEDTVDFKPNYDSREFEPIVLPAAFPNLLVNGASGIAVGMATNLAPHNLVEVVQALRHLINHPKATIDDLMRFVPGPDLPTGGKIVGLDGIREAYESGRGSFRMRASVRIENVTPRRKGIVVTELPYNVGPERVIERIKQLVQTKKLQGIADVKDLTDRNKGLQLVIEVKNGFHPEALLDQLYRQTPMEDSFGINAVALVDGQPRTLGLKQMLEVYLDHRLDVVRRRSIFRRTKAQERLHLVEGLLIAILDIDEVIQLIRSSDDAAQAKSRLMDVFELSDIQATYILDMPLRRLTRYSTIELESEKSELERTIEELTAILDDDALLRKVVGDELVRGREDLRHPAPHRAAGVCRRPGDVGRTARGRRRPVLRADVVQRAARAQQQRRAARSSRCPGQARRGHRGRGHHRTRDHRRGDLARPADQARRARPPGAAADGERAPSAGRRPDHRVPRARAGRAGRDTDVARRGLARTGPRHLQRSRQTRPARGAQQPRLLGRHPARRR